MRVIPIERTRASGSKTARYLEMQPWISKGYVSISYNAKHKEMCLQHMEKITLNNVHRRDDICDSSYDAVKLALIDNVLRINDNKESNEVAKFLANNERMALMKRQNNKRGW